MSYKKLINFDNYYIHDDGRIYSIKYKKYLKPKYNKTYLCIGLCDNNKKRKWFFVHRLVYEAFKGQIPEGLEVDHINGIRDDNRLSNLRLLTKIENNQKKNHLEQYKEIDKERNIKRKDKRKEYYEKNKEERKRKQREYYEKNKEEINRKRREKYHNTINGNNNNVNTDKNTNANADVNVGIK